MSRKSLVFTPDFPNLFQPIDAIVERWMAHWQKIHVRNGGVLIDHPNDDGSLSLKEKSKQPRIVMRDRAERLVRARARAAGLSNKKELLEPLRESLKHGVTLAGPATEHAADELAAQTAVPWTSIDLGSTTEGFPIAGAERTWGSAMPGRPVQAILAHRIANPIVFVDELDKAGVAYSSRGTATSAHNALLSLVEPGTARRWPCPYYGLRFDMSHVNWILAANAIAPLPAPLRSRLRIVEVRPPNRAEMVTFAAREVEQRDLPEDASAVLEQLILAFPEGYGQLDLRRVLRMIDDRGLQWK